jgi:hypothetical protein
MTSAAIQRPPLEQEFEEPDVSSIVTEDDTPVDNIASEKQQRLLTEPLYTSWNGPPSEDAPRAFVASANVGLFPALREPPLVPDVFLSVDVSVHPDFWEKRHRSYFFWEFGKPPDVVIEVVSNREGEELGAKKSRYARMRVAHYVVWDPSGQLGDRSLHTFELRGQLYIPIVRPVFENIGLSLVIWDGSFEGIAASWLRWATLDGAVLLTGAESAEQERQRAEQERQRAEQEKQRADRLLEKLRAAGINPDD